MRSCSPWTDSDNGRWPLVDGIENLPQGNDAWLGMIVWDTMTDAAYQYRGRGPIPSLTGLGVGGWQIFMQPSQAYTPTLTNVTINTGTLAFQYHINNGWLEFSGRYTFGTGDVISGLVGISVPTDAAGVEYFCWDNAATSPGNPRVASWGYVRDASPVATYPLIGVMGTSTRLDLYSSNAAAATGMTTGIVSATSPITFANTDFIQVGVKYRLAWLRQL